MKIFAVNTAILTILVGQAEVLPSQAAEQGVAYIVTRAASAESRALLSARLIKLNATNLRWYDDVNMLRAELPKGALAQVRSDPDVILALPEEDHPLPAAPAAPEVPVQKSAAAAPDSGAPAQQAPPAMAPQQPASIPSMGLPMMPAPVGMAPPMPVGGFGMGMAPMGAPLGMGMGTGMGMGMGATGLTGLADSLAGGVVMRLLYRAPSCKISVAKTVARFAAEGGDEVIEVKGSGSCAWQAQASVPWIKIMSGTGVSGSSIVSYTVAPADGKNRAGSISIVGTAGGSPIKGKATVVVIQAVGTVARANGEEASRATARPAVAFFSTPPEGLEAA